MERLSEGDALQLCEEMLLAVGMQKEPAANVASHLVDASLRGIDSHGLERIPQYIRRIRSGEIRADVVPEVAWVQGAIIQVRGNAGLGIPAMQMAADRLGPLAHQNGIAAAAVVDVTHTGRIGAYVESLANGGCFAFALGGGAYEQGGRVAPHGGAKGVLSTNPYAFSLPGGSYEPVVVDFATSTVAQGKVMLARNRGEALPPDSLLDRDGNPSQRPEDFYNGGSLLTAAGPKGYGMALIAELIGCALIGAPKEFNWLIVALDLARFRTPSAFATAAQQCLAEIKAVPPRDGFDEVMIPGEPERRMRAQRRKDGIPIDAVLLQSLRDAAVSLDMMPDILA
ncbi:MAG: Ldh family oxidoreductase [Kiloniellales bacterium]